ncbi:efflux RND transporter periplasmic adaptor subunit [bacterium]|nr:efflux RND transporter periplasmic adaptor subunit [bacterium]
MDEFPLEIAPLYPRGALPYKNGVNDHTSAPYSGMTSKGKRLSCNLSRAYSAFIFYIPMLKPRFLGLLCLVGTLSIGCSDSSDAGQGAVGAPAAPIPSVEVIQARLGSLPLEERMSGVVHAKNQVVLYAEISAPIIKIEVQNGDFVRAGEPLVYLRDKQYQDQINQAEAALQISQADAKRTAATLSEVKNRLDRIQQLADRQLESQQQLEALQAQYAGADAANDQALARISQAEANLEEQREMLRRTVIRAPISGYIGQRNAEVGMRADPGSPLFVLGEFDNVRVKISITDRMMNRIVVGQTAVITVENDQEHYISAKVSRISPFLEAGSFSAEAEIDIDNTDRLLRPGMFVTVDVLWGEAEQAVLVPESVLYENPTSGVLGVYVAPSLSSETPLKEPDEYDVANPPQLTEPTPMEFRAVEVLARGHGIAGVAGVGLGDWVVAVGQNLIRPVEGKASARARPITWERIASLQNMQDQDLLRDFMAKQQKIAAQESK